MDTLKQNDTDFPEADFLFEGDDVVEPALPDQTPLEADDFTPEELNEYLTAEVMLPRGGEQVQATIQRRVKDEMGRPVGKRHSNPVLDTRLYEVSFPDGSTDVYTTNIIAENLFSQVDEFGRTTLALSEIIGHRSNEKAVKATDPGYLDGTKKHTTAGWEIECEYRDGSTSWIPLKDAKEAFMVEVAEYAIANGLDKEPAFAWWARYALRKRDRIIKKVRSRYHRRTHKYGIEFPHSVEEALDIDRRTGTDFWRKAIEKEMRNVMVAFEFRDDNVVPIGYKEITCHLVFDIKSDLTRKARMVADGHLTDPPKDSTYSSVVSRDSVRLAFMLAGLNDLDVMAADIQNAYLNAPTGERCWAKAGPEFGKENAGRPVLIVRALYGLKSSAKSWRDHISQTLRDAGYISCLADSDVWMKPVTRPSDGFKYWEYVLVYVDDLLVVSHDPQAVMDIMNKSYTLKPGSVKVPTEYLGAIVKPFQRVDNKPCWAMSSELYRG